MKVLVCDDVYQKYEVLQEFLKGIGITEIEWVEYESELFNLLSKKKYDVLFLDMTLHRYKNCTISNLGGKEILYELCDKEIIIPVIVFTSYSDFSEDSRWSWRSANWTIEKYMNTQFLSDDIDYLAEKGDEDVSFIEGLHEYMCNHYNIYAGTIYLDETKTDWQDGIKKLIQYIENTQKK